MYTVPRMEPNGNSFNLGAGIQPAGQPQQPFALGQPPVPAVSAQMSSTSSMTPSQMPVAADDSDTIEAEWVEAVKQTVMQHKNDPYVLSKNIESLRAAYLKRRYNKDIKLAE